MALSAEWLNKEKQAVSCNQTEKEFTVGLHVHSNGLSLQK